jgi:drug/metabolite transporter (DMT)-like permease|tara:strand:+ start:841 stop:1764 length:924 start_codon:yes stop_codon:yes gene_type:complete
MNSMSVDEDRKYMLIALFGSTLISFAPLLYQYSDTNPATGAFFRMSYALPFLALIIYFRKSTDTRSNKSRLLTFYAGLLISLDFIGYHTAIDYVGTGIATMIGNSQVIIVTLVSWKFLGEKPNKSIIFALPIVILGLVLISGIWDDEPYGEDPFRGVIAGVFAAIFYSSFLIVYRYSNRELAPAQNLQFDATAGAAIGLLCLGLLPLTSLGVEPINFEPTWPGHAWLLLLAIFCQVAGWIAITYALPRLPGAKTSFAVLLQPVLTITWGLLLLEETPSLQQSAGILLILGSVIAVTIFGNTKVATKV